MSARRSVVRWAILGGFLALMPLALAGEELPELKKDEAKKEMMRPPVPPEEALVQARLNGKYSMLLRQIKVPRDAESNKDGTDGGLRDVTEYGGHVGLPKGHWVYVAPYWYIWRDVASAVRPKRPYGPEQLTGPPDVVAAGDSTNAWCPLTEDEPEEWLLLEYAEPIIPTAVLVYAHYGPGAVSRVTVFKLDGTEVEVWRGQDPTPQETEQSVAVIPFTIDFRVNRIKVYLDAAAVPSWNEVDTVGVRDINGGLHWPTAAETSTTYAQQSIGVDTGFIIADNGLMERIKGLENELKELKEIMKSKQLETEVRELKDLVKELKEMMKKKEEK